MNNNLDKDPLKNVPDWATDPLVDLLEGIKYLNDIVTTTANGLLYAKRLPEIIEKNALGVDVAKQLIKENLAIKTPTTAFELLQTVSGIAAQETDKGFPFLFSFGLVNLYTLLETAIKNLVINYFKNSNGLASIDAIAKIKIEFAEYHKMNDDEKTEYLFEQYEKNIGAGLKYGVSRFEKLLAPIGFSGRTSTKASSAIFELSQLRNNILHRGGTADKMLISSCPDLNYQLGQKINVGTQQYEKYMDAVSNYLNILIIRVGEKWDADMSSLHHHYEQ
jgi:hypothetical protein